MSNHRLWITLDDERYERVSTAARRRGISMAAVIQEAIDLGLPRDERRRAVARLILSADPMTAAPPRKLRAELDQERERRSDFLDSPQSS
jgi:Ribbon-helix-helix protein, copG family